MSGKECVLVAETDELIRELLGRWLGEAGYEVVALDRTGGTPLAAPVLIIVNLPSPRAPQALIRPLQAAYSAPILALSARFRRGLGASANAARVLGVSAVLPKPFARKELLCAVRSAIERGA